MSRPKLLLNIRCVISVFSFHLTYCSCNIFKVTCQIKRTFHRCVHFIFIFFCCLKGALLVWKLFQFLNSASMAVEGAEGLWKPCVNVEYLCWHCMTCTSIKVEFWINTRPSSGCHINNSETLEFKCLQLGTIANEHVGNVEYSTSFKLNKEVNYLLNEINFKPVLRSKNMKVRKLLLSQA